MTHFFVKGRRSWRLFALPPFTRCGDHAESSVRSPLLEDGFRDHPVDPLGDVSDLHDVTVHRHVGDHVGILACQIRELADDEVDRLTAILIALSRSGLRPIII